METKLKRIMKEKGISQKDLVKITGNTQGSISHLCVRGIVRIRTAKKYAKPLDCSILDLLEF